jgi:leucyl aminopeptidase
VIEVNFQNLQNRNIKNYILFCKNKFTLNTQELNFFKLKKNDFETLVENNKTENKRFINIDCNSGRKIILINLNEKDTHLDFEKVGGNFYDYICGFNSKQFVFINSNIERVFVDYKIFYEKFIFGAKLKSYNFSKYKTSKETDIINFIIQKNKKLFASSKKKIEALVQGINFTKDLVSEPGNILHPDEYVSRITKLKKFGLKVTVFDKKKLAKLGMNALLGVGQGSTKGSYLAVIEWKGSRKKDKPIAFVGKGVCFDTGGISLKPAKFMEDMTYDMAGSAVVVGLMKSLAIRNAKVNAIGVVGLVENMPDGNAQRPGDIVKSYSGKTIEILNTDAEGRLVLADAISYTEKKFKPKFIVDLATLTGAIIVSLGSEYAGLFSNDDKISDQLYKAGEKVGEKVWRMPLNENYDKLINSKKADMQNINYVGGAGSTTAAQFLQRFILNKTPWAHLDIAGMAFSKYGGALNSGGATGYGVRLLNQLLEDNYE